MKILKNKSITKKMLTIYSFVFLFMIGLIILGSYFFMDDFFISYNKNLIEKEVVRYIDEGSLGEEKSNKELSMNTGCILYIYDENNELVWNNNMIDLLKGEISRSQVEELREGSSSEEPRFILFRSDVLAESKLVGVVKYDKGMLLITVKQMGILHEVEQIFLQFLVLITTVVYILAFITIYIFANRLAKPIIELKDVTERIASMDFETELDESGKDEINELAVSINIMARKLQTNIETISQTNIQLEQELSKEKNLESMRRRFVSDVSHELKNPISMIIAYAEGLIMNIPKTDEAKERYYHVLFEEGNKVSELISDLLELSSYQSGTFMVHKETVNLTEMISIMLERYEEVGKTKEINVLWNQLEKVEIHGDPLRIGQVITNLLSNAMKNVDDKGTVAISVTKSGEKSVLTVRNTGKLIPESELFNIWESFYQVDTNTEGNGLGLAITKSIVDLHQGTIRAYIENEMNCFEVII